MACRVLQVVDSLAAGGAERVSVTLANGLIGHVEASYLCATRAEGPLAATVSPDVGYRFLRRRGRVSLKALVALRTYVAEHRIDVVHAHGSSVYFTAAALAFSRRRPRLIWHDHNGRLDERSSRLARLGSTLSERVFVVSEQLRNWHIAAGSKPSRVRVFPNFVSTGGDLSPADDLPGPAGERVIVVGNLRPEKNHVGIVRAFARVAAQRPHARLLLAGAMNDPSVAGEVRETAIALGVADKVIQLGVRDDIESVLLACDLGILFSHAEGFPMALLEYGRAGLAAIASDVGQVRSLSERSAGVVVVARGDEAALAAEMVRLLADPAARSEVGESSRASVLRHYSDVAIIPDVVQEYSKLLQVER